MELPALSAVFVAGVLTILTPCCLPLIPPLLSGSVGHRLRPPVVVFGSVLSFTTLGIAVGAAGAITQDAIRTPAFLVLIALGAVMADDDLHAWFAARTSRLSAAASRHSAVLDESRHPLASAFVLGLLLGVIWLPCVGPILGAVLAYASTTGSAARGGLFLFVYGVGFGTPLVGVAYGGKRLSRSVADRFGDVATPEVARRLAGYVLVVTGVALLFDVDRALLALL